MSDYYNRRRISTAKINSSVPLGSLYSKPNQVLFQYVLSHIPAQVSHGFVWVAQKGKCSTSDLSSLKEAMRNPEVSK